MVYDANYCINVQHIVSSSSLLYILHPLRSSKRMVELPLIPVHCQAVYLKLILAECVWNIPLFSFLLFACTMQNVVIEWDTQNILIRILFRMYSFCFFFQFWNPFINLNVLCFNVRGMSFLSTASVSVKPNKIVVVIIVRRVHMCV